MLNFLWANIYEKYVKDKYHKVLVVLKIHVDLCFAIGEHGGVNSPPSPPPLTDLYCIKAKWKYSLFILKFYFQPPVIIIQARNPKRESEYQFL